MSEHAWMPKQRTDHRAIRNRQEEEKRELREKLQKMHDETLEREEKRRELRNA